MMAFDIMNLKTYILKSNFLLTKFEFVSEGPKGLIPKIIEFQRTTNPGVYNLAFGDKNPITKSMDDLSVSNNTDAEKVLATVVLSVYTFTDKYPDSLIYAAGSTIARTRLFRMGITKYQMQLNADFYIYGQSGEHFHFFEPDKHYEGFLAQREFK